jgi:hypothetical protein
VEWDETLVRIDALAGSQLSSQVVWVGIGEEFRR